MEPVNMGYCPVEGCAAPIVAWLQLRPVGTGGIRCEGAACAEHLPALLVLAGEKFLEGNLHAPADPAMLDIRAVLMEHVDG